MEERLHHNERTLLFEVCIINLLALVYLFFFCLWMGGKVVWFSRDFLEGFGGSCGSNL